MNQNEQPITPNPLENPATQGIGLRRGLAIAALAGTVAGGGLVMDHLNQDDAPATQTNILSATKFGNEAELDAAKDPVAHPRFVNQAKPTDTTINIGDSGIKFGSKEGEVSPGAQTDIGTALKIVKEVPVEQPAPEVINDIGLMPPVEAAPAPDPIQPGETAPVVPPQTEEVSPVTPSPEVTIDSTVIDKIHAEFYSEAPHQVVKGTVILQGGKANILVQNPAFTYDSATKNIFVEWYNPNAPDHLDVALLANIDSYPYVYSAAGEEAPSLVESAEGIIRTTGTNSGDEFADSQGLLFGKQLAEFNQAGPVYQFKEQDGQLVLGLADIGKGPEIDPATGEAVATK